VAEWPDLLNPDALLFTLVLVGLHEGVFLATLLGFNHLLKTSALPRWEVDQGRVPPIELRQEATRQVARGHVLFAAIFPLVIYPLWVRMGGDLASGWPGLKVAAAHLLACILIQDTLFYWSHRTLHSKWLFRQVHRKHHRFRHVRGISAEFAHPVEDLANVVAFFAPPILLATPFPVFALWVAIRVFETMLAHSGFGFEGVSSRHAFHHLHATKGCYGSFFGLWDRLMGTDAAWREWRRGQAHR
jgi:sterol desaturase/sphingolipid hydroxylase (fatty acid hydroxylase superfamily)